MENIIKKFDVQLFAEILEDNTDMDENKIKQLYDRIITDNELKNVSFYFYTEEDTYFYESKKEKNIEACLAKHCNKEIVDLYNDRIFIDYADELYRNSDIDNIEFGDNYSKITISEEYFYSTLKYQFLYQEDIILRLVNTDYFIEELNEIKRECLLSLLDEIYIDAKFYVREQEIGYINK